ncbi:TetR family transcriptional regulator [Kitasatospora viridis]|uniref:TetR family transcriptional regulator n=1 Tax=Kitasatospora viridis TaxID=281105 RepID=A0A561SFJ6_9ACTN|nr:TetR family transcriptional regulator [Kitasatospora viridis]TWF73640.1 TetR family transcriptional regulator [Kitasatospora viridis]
MSESDPAPVGRGERRTRSRQAILAAARQLFSELGYEQTTVRAVAHRAGVDPALVMKHFGSKEQLFDAVSEIGLSFGGALGGPADQLGDRLLAHVLADIDGRPDRSMPVLRSMLTHPQAAEAVRCAVADPGDSAVADALTGDDVELRASLVGAVVLGLLVARYLLRVPEVDHAPAARLVELLGPCLRPLLAADAASGGGATADGATADGMSAGGMSAGGMSVDHGSAGPLAGLAAAESARLAAAEEVDRLAREALAGGASYGEVGQLLGISRQAARKRWPRTEEADSLATT